MAPRKTTKPTARKAATPHKPTVAAAPAVEPQAKADDTPAPAEPSAAEAEAIAEDIALAGGEAAVQAAQQPAEVVDQAVEPSVPAEPEPEPEPVAEAPSVEIGAHDPAVPTQAETQAVNDHLDLRASELASYLRSEAAKFSVDPEALAASFVDRLRAAL